MDPLNALETGGVDSFVGDLPKSKRVVVCDWMIKNWKTVFHASIFFIHYLYLVGSIYVLKNSDSLDGCLISVNTYHMKGLLAVGISTVSLCVVGAIDEHIQLWPNRVRCLRWAKDKQDSIRYFVFCFLTAVCCGTWMWDLHQRALEFFGALVGYTLITDSPVKSLGYSFHLICLLLSVAIHYVFYFSPNAVIYFTLFTGLTTFFYAFVLLLSKFLFPETHPFFIVDKSKIV